MIAWFVMEPEPRLAISVSRCTAKMLRTTAADRQTADRQTDSSMPAARSLILAIIGLQPGFPSWSHRSLSCCVDYLIIRPHIETIKPLDKVQT